MKAISHKEYEDKLNFLEIDFWPVEAYINSRTPILHECLAGHRWKVRPPDILKGRGCPHCFKITSLEYNNSIKHLNMEAIEPYINRNTSIMHKCVKGTDIKHYH